MRTVGLAAGGGIVLILTTTLVACGKMKQSDARDSDHVRPHARAETQRQKAACGSSVAYARLKDLLFDDAIRERGGDRANLDTLADYSFARMEDPVVKGWDPALDITRCNGHMILDIPAGAERAFDGERHLQAQVNYTAQSAADGSGYVYRLQGAEPIVAKLAAFNLTSVAYRPPAAIDEGQAGPDVLQPTMAVTEPSQNAARTAPAFRGTEASVPLDRQQRLAAERASEPAAPQLPNPQPASPVGEAGEATVRAFYRALGVGNGAAASAYIIPEKRSGRAFSPEAISRFYGKLAEPIRVTSIVPQPGGTFRVSYRYSAGRSYCNGSAVVSLTKRDGRDLIRSIRALSGC